MNKVSKNQAKMNTSKGERILNTIQFIRSIDPRIELQTFAVFLNVAEANYNNGHKGVIMKDIAHELDIAQSSTSRNVFRLSNLSKYNKKDGTFKQNLGLLRCEEDPTFRRRKLVFLTKSGSKVIEILKSNPNLISGW